jgi:acyl-CoA reductase-like NAD-dependent aldehyde dehydrogenase
LRVDNPATEEVIAEIRAASPEQAARAAREARRALDDGALGTAGQRSATLHRLADLLVERADDLLRIVICEIGTPITTARVLHVDVPVALLRWLADAATTDRTERVGVSDGPPRNEAVVLYRPIGVVAAITAYNYPLMFAATKVGAAMAAGCPVVLLPSPQAPLSTLFFVDLALEAGLPPRALSVLVGGADVAQALVGAPEVAKVSFTGSVPAGAAVMRTAADGLCGVVLELGGKSPAILLPSADIPSIAAQVHHRYLRGAGQGCAAPTRILVPQSRMAEFTEASRAVYSAVQVGDPWHPDTLVGPVISRQHKHRVNGYIDGALADGGHIVARGDLPAPPGWYVRPTLIGGLANDAIINRDEVFGPVATVQPYRSVDEAVAIANDSTFGLHAAIFGDFEEAFALAPAMAAGHVTINGGGPLRPDAPIGGWKHSGIGREQGEAGIREFLEPVTVQWPVS